MILNKLLGAGGSGGNIDFVGFTSETAAGDAVFTLTLNSGLTNGSSSSVSEGDLVLIYAAVAYTTSPSLVSGYTSLYSVSTPGYGPSIRVMYKFMGSTPDTSVTVNCNGFFADSASVFAYVFSGVDAATPVDVTAEEDFPDTIFANPPPVTPTVSGATVLGCQAGNGQSYDTSLYSDTAGDYDFFNSESFGERDGLVLGVGYKSEVSGTFDPSALSFPLADNTNYDSYAITLALTPA